MTTASHAKMIRLLLALAGMLALANAGAQTAPAPAPAPVTASQPAPAVDEARIKELGRLVARTLPIDMAFQTQLDKEPTWPLMDKAARLPAEKLVCARQRLSTAGFLETRTAEARDFAKRTPAQVEPAIRVLSAGAADMAQAFFVAGAERSQTGKDVDNKDVVARFTPAQLAAFSDLENMAEHRPLRQLIGMPDYASDRVAEILDRRPSGDIRATIRRIMLGALTHCDISLADIR